MLVAVGDFDSAGGQPASCIAIWDGTNWSALGQGMGHIAGVNALAVYNGELYAAGSFDTAGGQPASCIASWDGANWSSLGSGILHYGRVNTLAVYKGSLYVGGEFRYAGGMQVNNLARWTTPAKVADSTNSSCTVYPNPSNGKFTIKSSVVSHQSIVEVFNVLGQQVYSNSFQIPVSGFQIDLSGQPSGIYLYRIITDSGTLVGEGKLIKE
jgi:hypothetical protein